MRSRLTLEAVEAMVADRRRAIEPEIASVTLRHASPDDPSELVGALPLRGGSPLAHPFRRTADLVRVLEFRAAQLNGAGKRSSHV